MTDEEYSLWRCVYITALEQKDGSVEAREKANSAVRHYREDVKPPHMTEAELKNHIL